MLTAKFVIHDIGGSGVSDKAGNNDCNVVPSRNFFVEAESLQYSKHKLDSATSIDDVISTVLTGQHDMAHTIHNITGGLYFGGEDELPYEIIAVKITTNNDNIDIYIGRDCHLYILNTSGKTIDSVYTK